MAYKNQEASFRKIWPRRDLDYQWKILPSVSRTFALTIPVLPERLSNVVANAYLLFRIADTIEDDKGLKVGHKIELLKNLLSTVRDGAESKELASELANSISQQTPASEKDLVFNLPRVNRITQCFEPDEHEAVTECLRVMCEGMPAFQSNRDLGLADLDELDSYCYTVAGSVGEMLFKLFCSRSPELASDREETQSLAISFGKGLQLTNILKDVWDDFHEGRCWLPRSLFNNGKFTLRDLKSAHTSKEYQLELARLVGIAHDHLQNALAFTTRISPAEVGIRRFCLWALGMAVMTLRKISQNPHYATSNQVKISRNTVKATVFICDRLVANDKRLRTLFNWLKPTYSNFG